VFDAFFAYRFLYKLRNAQHVDFPPLSVVISETADGGTTGSVRFQPDALLGGLHKWGSVKTEPENFPEEFSLVEHVATMMQCLEWIAYEVAEIERPHLEEHVGVISDALQKTPCGPGFRAVAYLPDEGDPDHMEMRQLYAVVLRERRDPPTVIARPMGPGDEWVTLDWIVMRLADGARKHQGPKVGLEVDRTLRPPFSSGTCSNARRVLGVDDPSSHRIALTRSSGWTNSTNGRDMISLDE